MAGAEQLLLEFFFLTHILYMIYHYVSRWPAVQFLPLATYHSPEIAGGNKVAILASPVN